MKKAIMLSTLAGALLIGSQAYADTHIDGNGQMVTAQRHLSNFNAIKVDDRYKLNITVGKPASIVLKGDSNLLPKVHMSVFGRTLRIRDPEDTRFETRQPIEINITTPTLSAINAEDGTTVNIQNAQQTLSVHADDDAQVTATGSVKALSVNLSDRAQLHASKLNAGAITLEADDRSAASLSVQNNFNASVGDFAKIGVQGTAAAENIKAEDSALVDASKVSAAVVNAHAEDHATIRVQAHHVLNARASDDSLIYYTGAPTTKAVHSSDNAQISAS